MGALARWGKWGNGVASKLRTPKLLTHVLPLSRPLGSAHLCLARRSLGEGGSLTSPRLRSLAASLAVKCQSGSDPSMSLLPVVPLMRSLPRDLSVTLTDLTVHLARSHGS